MSFLRQWLPQRSPSRAIGTPDDGEVRSRPSNALAQFFQGLSSRTHPSVLELGPVCHSTVTLLTAAGAKLYTEDLLEVVAGQSGKAETPDAEASSAIGLLETNLLYPEESLDGVLAWDMFDYLPEELLQPTSARLHALLKAGGLLLTLFRKRSGADTGNRYRLLTQHSFAVIPSALALRPQRALQNRAILNLFAAFSSSRTFIGRDNLREVLFVK